MRASHYLLNDLGLNQQLATDFFIAFGRFEYALKTQHYVDWNQQTGYVKGAKWEQWANDNGRRQAFNGLLTNPQSKLHRTARSAYDYLLNSPPKKQKWDDVSKTLSWEDPCLLPSNIELCQMVEALKRMRNNLYHGGKYLTKDSQNETAAQRHYNLVSAGLTLIEVFLELDADVCAAYDQ